MFRLLALAIGSPLVFLGVLEALLRIVGFGGSYPLFIDAPDRPGYRQVNPDVIQRFYRGAPELGADPIPFANSRPPNGYRIVVQGGSTAAGFPYGRWGGLAGMLGDRLEATFPEREIEVISTAMSAVNSHALLDFADEIVAIEPDAVLIYAGHNEYLGIWGVGSALPSAGAVGRALSPLRVYQLLQQIISTLRGAVTSTRSVAGRGTLIARAASGARIPFESERYWEGVRQLETNLGEILRIYQRAGIPVYLATLVSNERGLAPLAGAEAEAWWMLAEMAKEIGAIDAARVAYRGARDRDELRLRAPEVFNQRIRALAAPPRVTLVEAKRHLEAESPDGIVGNELLLEHVHPNARGYFLLADAFFEALRKQGVIGDWSRAPSRDESERDMPITAVDHMLADHAIRELMSDYPFSDTRREVSFPQPRDEIGKIALQRQRGDLDWIDGMERLLHHYRREGRTDRARVVARIAAQAYPTLSAPNFSAGMLMLENREFARSRRYLERSLDAEPNHAPTLRGLVRACRQLNDADCATRYRTRLREAARAPSRRERAAP